MPANSDPGATVNWYITNEGELVINPEDDSAYADSQHSGTIDTSKEYSDIPWKDYQSSISSVTVNSVTKPIYTNRWFGSFSNANSFDLSLLDMSNVKSTMYMFSDCSSLSRVPEFLNGSTESLTGMLQMFHNCSSLSDISSLSGWNTSSVTNMYALFEGCSSLSDISSLSGWNTSSVTDMRWVFHNCSSLVNVDLSGWNTSSVIEIVGMFYDCDYITTVDLSGWNVASVIDPNSLFKGCNNLSELDLYGWDPPDGANFAEMFYGCNNLKTIWCDKSWTSTESTRMFSGANSLISCSSGRSYELNNNSSSMANPDTGYFSYKPLINYTPTIQKIINSNLSLGISSFDPFEFTLSSKSNNAGLPSPMPENNSLTTDDSGLATWSEITFYKAGTYEYNVQETKGDIQGMTYDETVHTLTITVSSDGEPSITTEWDGEKEGETFVIKNTCNCIAAFSPTIQVAIEKKSPDGSNVPVSADFSKADKFNFTIKGKTGSEPLPKTLSVTSDDSGRATWPEIMFFDEGSYDYVITESKGSDDSLTYDTTEHTMKITAVIHNDNKIPDLSTYPFGELGIDPLFSTTADLCMLWDPYLSGLAEGDEPWELTDEQILNGANALRELAGYCVSKWTDDYADTPRAFSEYLQAMEITWDFPEDGDYIFWMQQMGQVLQGIYADLSGEGYPSLSSDLATTKGAAFTRFWKLLAYNSSKEVWNFVIEEGYFGDLAPYIPSGTDEPVQPEMPPENQYDDRHVRWAVYKDGTLVINGDNEPNYNNHGDIGVCSDTVIQTTTLASPDEPQLFRYSYLDLDFDRIETEGLSRWDGNYMACPNVCQAICRVEFAKPTAPTSMVGWFMNCLYLWEIDTTNLDTSQLANIDYFLASLTMETRHAPLPMLSGWDVSNLMSAQSAFKGWKSITGSPLVYPSGDVLDLRGWKVHDGCVTDSMFSTSAPEGTLIRILCENEWNCVGDSMFKGQTKLVSLSGEPEFDPNRVDGSMANPQGYFDNNTDGLFDDPETMREGYREVLSELRTNFDWSTIENLLPPSQGGGGLADEFDPLRNNVDALVSVYSLSPRNIGLDNWTGYSFDSITDGIYSRYSHNSVDEAKLEGIKNAYKEFFEKIYSITSATYPNKDSLKSSADMMSLSYDGYKSNLGEWLQECQPAWSSSFNEFFPSDCTRYMGKQELLNIAHYCSELWNIINYSDNMGRSGDANHDILCFYATVEGTNDIQTSLQNDFTPLKELYTYTYEEIYERVLDEIQFIDLNGPIGTAESGWYDTHMKAVVRRFSLAFITFDPNANTLPTDFIALVDSFTTDQLEVFAVNAEEVGQYLIDGAYDVAANPGNAQGIISSVFDSFRGILDEMGLSIDIKDARLSVNGINISIIRDSVTYNFYFVDRTGLYS